jgi:hypothetical protein
MWCLLLAGKKRYLRCYGLLQKKSRDLEMELGTAGNRQPLEPTRWSSAHSSSSRTSYPRHICTTHLLSLIHSLLFSISITRAHIPQSPRCCLARMSVFPFLLSSACVEPLQHNCPVLTPKCRRAVLAGDRCAILSSLSSRFLLQI